MPLGILSEQLNMLMQKIIALLSLVMLFSCGGNSTTPETADKSADIISDDLAAKNSDQIIQVDGCYLEILKRDTFSMKLDQSGKKVNGTLKFDNFEKDASSGTVHGTVENDLLRLWYNFASEGMNSVMEVYFKKSDNSLLRGVGAVESRGDSTFFSDTSKIEYAHDQGFLKIPCDQLP